MKTEREIKRVRDEMMNTCAAIVDKPELEDRLWKFMCFIAAMDWVLEEINTKAENPVAEFVRVLKEAKRRAAEMN